MPGISLKRTCASVLAACFALIGCRAGEDPQPETKATNAQTGTPGDTQPTERWLASVDLGYGTDPFDQTIETRRLFPSDNAPALIIRCTGRVGNVGSWETHAVSWPELAKTEVAYRTVNIQVHDHYDYDSGPYTMQGRYWPVDIDGDKLDDLVVFFWEFGARGWHEEDEDGQYRPHPFDRPAGLRLVCRKMLKGCAFGIASDETLAWGDVKKSPGKYAGLLRRTLPKCTDPVWRTRLGKAIEQLTDEPKSDGAK